ncbi:MAG TPA: deoxyguanosinetriphosphate triphosphohydrolase [Dissulfurispiraceae bacterium]|nr:deoxyguanosinetriphosphate triphosphohydrolase [Dissulfurispiraceae bacterium]
MQNGKADGLSVRELTEQIEAKILHPNASHSTGSRGRVRPEENDDLRTCYQRDRDRIIHSKAFRRLKHKTQVFLAPRGDHYRTRLTHVLEVAQISRTIARALRLNEDLTEAMALGHDLGHTPFGHAGEEVLNELYPGGFDHYKQSLRVVDILEKDGKGLNLTHEVRDGILKHSKGRGMIMPELDKDRPATLEGQLVRIADIVAYLNHDLDDALRAGVVDRKDIPDSVTKLVGEAYGDRIDSMVRDVIAASSARDLTAVVLSEHMGETVYTLRDFMFAQVYEHPAVREHLDKAKGILRMLYGYYLENSEEVLRDIPRTEKNGVERLVCDFIAGMTDQFAFMTYEKIFLPQRWTVL